jgi:hypothetical protein
MPELGLLVPLPVVVPVVVMLSAPVPEFNAEMPSAAPVVVAALIFREVPAAELFAKIPVELVPVVVPVVLIYSAPVPEFFA